MARARKPRHRRTSLERLGVAPRGRLRQALGPGISLGDALVVALFVAALVVVLNPGRVAMLVGASPGRPDPRAESAALHVVAGAAAVIGLLGAIGAVLLARTGHPARQAWRSLLVFGISSVACLVCVQLLAWLDQPVRERWRSLVYLTPLPAFSIFFTVVYGQRRAVAATVTLALLTGMVLHTRHHVPGGAEPLAATVVLLCGGLVAVLGANKIRKRVKLLVVGALVGLTQAVLLAGLDLMGDKLRIGQPAPPEVLWALASGLAVGVLMTVSLPFIEWAFNVATDIRLLELSDQEQPLLRTLVSRAPGTDNHSRRVALLADAGAEAIGANALLARVGSYYHDIGKLCKPDHFIENIAGGESPHDRLRPSMSVLIIAAHTRDGLELAEEAGLPQAIIDIIVQHHGTSVIEFFYHRHREDAATRSALDEDFFRYAGPKPATREAAIVMIADAVEAASRTLAEPLPSRIRTLIRKITATKLGDGQLDQCHLTLSELHRIEDSFFRVLCAMYHSRIEYPEADLDPRRQRAQRALGA